MGIKGLFPFLREKAPAAIKERSLKAVSYTHLTLPTKA